MLHIPSEAAPFDYKIVYRYMYNAASAQALVFGFLPSGNAIWLLAFRYMSILRMTFRGHHS